MVLLNRIQSTTWIFFGKKKSSLTPGTSILGPGSVVAPKPIMFQKWSTMPYYCSLPSETAIELIIQWHIWEHKTAYNDPFLSAFPASTWMCRPPDSGWSMLLSHNEVATVTSGTQTRKSLQVKWCSKSTQEFLTTVLGEEVFTIQGSPSILASRFKGRTMDCTGELSLLTIQGTSPPQQGRCKKKKD